MPLTEALVSLSEAKAYLKLANSANDAMVTELIDHASGQIAMHAGRRLKSATYSGSTALIANGTGKHWIYCPEYPVTTWTGGEVIEDDGVTLTTLDDTGVRINSRGRIYLPAGPFPKGSANIKLSVTAGILAGTPEWKALQGAALRLIQVMWEDQQTSAARKQSLTVDGQTLTFASYRMPADIRDALAPFVRII